MFHCATMSSVASPIVRRKALNDVIRARVPKSRRRVFENIAARRETSVSQVVREALMQYAEAYEAAEAAKQPQPESGS